MSPTCTRQRFAYSPSARSNDSWVPSSVIPPSSRTTIAGSLSLVRAVTSRCRWPPESSRPVRRRASRSRRGGSGRTRPPCAFGRIGSSRFSFRFPVVVALRLPLPSGHGRASRWADDRGCGDGISRRGCTGLRPRSAAAEGDTRSGPAGFPSSGRRRGPGAFGVRRVPQSVSSTRGSSSVYAISWIRFPISPTNTGMSVVARTSARSRSVSAPNATWPRPGTRNTSSTT